METALIIALLLSCVLVLFGWRVLNWVWFNPKRLEKRFKKQGFKGNPYKLFYGDIKEITTMFEEANSKPMNLSDDVVPRIIPHLLGAVKKYGKKTYVWYGPEPTALVMDPELIREVTQQWEVFQKPRSLPYVKLLAQGILFFEGDRWVKQRKLLKPAFHMEKLKLMLPEFQKSASDMLNKWEKIVPLTGSIELNVWPHLETMTSDAISRTAFGTRYEDGRRVFELQSEQGRHFAESLRFLPTKRNRRMKQIAKEVDGLIKELINARQKGLRTGEAIDDDLLGILLESNSQEIDEKLRMTTREMIDECKLFYMAGLEATSSLLVWTLVLLSIHADWQSRAREEVLQRFGTNIPNFDGLNHLKLLR